MITVGAGPGYREQHTAIFDAARDRMIVFGGDIGLTGYTPSNEVWALTFAGMPTWQPLAIAGTPPPARERHAAVHDPVRDRLLVFGGRDGAGPMNDVWELSLSGTLMWSPLATSGAPPAARYSHTMIYDPVRDRLVIYGGQQDENETMPFDDVWALSLSGSPTWSPIATIGTAYENTGHLAVYDPLHDSMVMLGVSGMWELLFTPTPTWVQASSAPPDDLWLGAEEFAGCVDPSRQRMIVMGGEADFFNRSNQTFAVDLLDLSWSALGPEIPLPRSGHVMVYDDTRRQLVIHGGFGRHDLLIDAWILALGGSRTWTRVTGAGSGPSLPQEHAAIYAPSRGSMLVFGRDGSPGDSRVWELDLDGAPQWSELSTSGSEPGPRYTHSAVHDATRDRMVLFGGIVESAGGWSNEVWALDLAGTPTWAPIVPSGTPPTPRGDHAAIYDPVGDRMIVFGGRTGSSTITNQVWSLAFTPTPAWALLAPTGTGPTISEGVAGAYDPVRRRMLIYGSQGNHSSVYALSLDGPPVWTRLQPPAPGPRGRGQAALAFDVEGDRLALFGGQFNTAFEPVPLGDAWTLAFGTPLSVPGEGRAPAVELALPAPNPARSASTLRWSLPRATQGVLAIHDVLGRRVRILEAGVLAAGRHSASWDLRDDAGRRVEPGLYWCHWSSEAGHARRKILVLR